MSLAQRLSVTAVGVGYLVGADSAVGVAEQRKTSVIVTEVSRVSRVGYRLCVSRVRRSS